MVLPSGSLIKPECTCDIESTSVTVRNVLRTFSEFSIVLIIFLVTNPVHIYAESGSDPFLFTD